MGPRLPVGAPVQRAGRRSGSASAAWPSPASARRACCSTAPAGPLGPIIAWFDNRTAPTSCTAGRAGRASSALHRLTGLCPDPTFSLLKLLWLQAAPARGYGRGGGWLHVATLSPGGCPARWRPTSASPRAPWRSTSHSGQWAGGLLGGSACRPGLMRPLAGPGDRLGGLTAEAARRPGCRRGSRSASPATTMSAACWRSAATGQASLLDSMGTAEALTFIAGAPQRRRGVRPPRLQPGGDHGASRRSSMSSAACRPRPPASSGSATAWPQASTTRR